MNKPHKSTTHPEFFFHIAGNYGTVFFRQEKDGTWQASTAIRDPRDQFNRRTGRAVARRKYFQGKRESIALSSRPSYDDALRVFNPAYVRRALARRL